MRLVVLLLVVAGCLKIPPPLADDGPGSDADTNPCWSLAPSNYDPCESPDWGEAVDIELDGAYTVDTDAATLTRFPGAMTSGFGMVYRDSYLLVYADRFTVVGGASVEVIGARPLIVVANQDITVQGIVTTRSTGNTLVGCSAVGGLLMSSMGGGGGGYGGTGGAGGRGASGGGPVGDATLIPLTSGCDGTPGSAVDVSGTIQPGGEGGLAGGGIELSSRTSVVVESGGFVQAAGLGGRGGTTCGPGCSPGGGGGGSGGSILLEAPILEIVGSVCATGGGGGEGAANGDIGALGEAGECTASTGGEGGHTSVSGGDGGHGLPRSPADGGDGTSSGAGGGGGGGLGRIHFHGSATVSGTVIPTPE